MNQKKSSKILIVLSIIILIFILLAGIAFVYIKTDLFKNNKQLFLKYALQIVDSENGFIDSKLNKYLKKKKEIPYADEGTISFNVTSEGAQAKYKGLNNLNITFSGQVDTANSKNIQEINLNYSDTIKFPIKYKKIDDTVGLQTEFVGNKFIATKDDEKDELIDGENQAIGIDFSSIQKITQIQFTDGEKKNIMNTYLGILNENLTDEKFSKLEETNSMAYKMMLTGEELKNLVIKLLETLKNDQMTLNKLNEMFGTTADDIENQIENLNNNIELNDETLEITIYNQNGAVNKILVETSKYLITAEKNNNGNQLNYNLAMEVIEEKTTNVFKVSFEGLADEQQNVQEAYELILPNDSEVYTYKYSNLINFKESVEIEEFNDENSIILTNYATEQVNNFIESVRERIEQVNKQQMEQLEFEENPLTYITGIFKSDNEEETVELNEIEVTAFNAKFELYESTNLAGVTVKGLLSTIILNNTIMNENRQIEEINFNGEEYEGTEANLETIKNNVDTATRYRVEFEKKPETGVIYRAIINVK